MNTLKPRSLTSETH